MRESETGHDSPRGHAGPVAQGAEQIRQLMDAVLELDVDDPRGLIVADRIKALLADLQVSDGAAASPRERIDRSPVTGDTNPMSPPMRVEADGEAARCVVRLGRRYEGPPQRVHGGYVAVLLDHAMGLVASLSESGPHYTRSLTIEYLAGTPIDQQLEVSAQTDHVHGRKRWVTGKITAGDTVCATASGLWIQIPGDHA